MNLRQNARKPSCWSGNLQRDIREGWIQPSEILESDVDAQKVLDAYETIRQFQAVLDELISR